jgi:hypothetical protein
VTTPSQVGRRVSLRAERNGRDTRFLEAWVDALGALHLDGQDLGPGTAAVSDDGEYEWHRTIPASELPRLIALLGGEPGDGILDLLAHYYTGRASYELERVIRESGIRSELSVWS